MKIDSPKKRYLQQSGYTTALFLDKHFSRRRAGEVVWLSGVVAVTFLFLTFFIFPEKKLVGQAIFGGFEIFLAVFLLFGVYWLFLGFLESSRVLPFAEIQNAWEQGRYGAILSFPAARMVRNIADEQNIQAASFWSYVLEREQFLWLWRRLNVPLLDLRQKVQAKYPPDATWSLPDVLRLTWQKALASNHLQIEEADMLIAIFELDKFFQDVLFDFEIEETDLRQVADWQRRRTEELRSRGRFWSRENLLNTKGIGKDWSAGYTLNLDRLAMDITESVFFHPPPAHLYGHGNEIELLERMLVRTAGAGNVVLVGPPGVGRHTLLRALGAKINRGQTLGPLRYKRLLQIDSASVISGALSLNDVVQRIETLFGEALLAANVILVINDLDAFLDPHPEAGRVNATEALLPFLQSRLHTIGITTVQGYQETIGKNPQLERLVSKLELSEPSASQTLLLLQDEVARVERQTGLWFSNAALQEIVNLTGKLIQSLPNPEKSLEILEETAVFVATKLGERVVLPVHVQKVITLRTKVPVEKIAGAEKDTLLNLETILHERIVGQDEAINEISDALRRARSGIRSEKKPIGSFLFLGPTGVGKTETTKALAAVYFGSEQRIIRFDMSEYQEVRSIERLIGEADRKASGLLTEAVITNPFSLILLDELEKAHPKVLDLFLQVLDEGRLTDALGRTVSFVNTMIIATSNAGAELIREMVKAGKNPAEAREQLLDTLQHQGTFRPEFLNRFDAVIIFQPLGDEELTQVALMLLKELNARLLEKDIQINVTPELARSVAKGGYNAEFGARPLRRFIQERIENYVAKGLISGTIKRGQEVEITPEMLESK